MEQAVSLYRVERHVHDVGGRSLARVENDHAALLIKLDRWDHIGGNDALRPHFLLTMAELHHGRGELSDAMEWTLQRWTWPTDIQDQVRPAAKSGLCWSPAARRR